MSIVKGKMDTRPFDVMLPGMKMAKVWLNEDGSLKEFEVKVPMLRNIWHVEVAQNGEITKAVDKVLGNTVDSKYITQIHNEIKEVLKGYDDCMINKAQAMRAMQKW